MKNEIKIFENQEIKLEVNMKDETVWLTLNQMAELFERDKSVISRHIKNALNEELDSSVVAKYATTAEDGKSYQVEYYNLDMIISVGYRVKSQRGVIFRKWANEVLKEYLLKGVAINKNRLEYFKKTVQLVDIAHRIDSSSKELKDILDVIHTYSYSLGLLDDYDHRVLEKKKGHVSDEIITYLTGPGYRSYVNHFLAFNGREGLHDASWRSIFGTNDYHSGGSHGCVNLPIPFAEKVNDTMSSNDKVLVKE